MRTCTRSEDTPTPCASAYLGISCVSLTALRLRRYADPSEAGEIARLKHALRRAASILSFLCNVSPFFLLL
eukprot:895359-Rhodomonas_salina.1